MKRLLVAAALLALTGCVTSKWTLNFIDGTTGDGDGFACFKNDPKNPKQLECSSIQTRGTFKKQVVPGDTTL